MDTQITSTGALLENPEGEFKPERNPERVGEVLSLLQGARRDAERQRLPHMKRWLQFYRGQQLPPLLPSNRPRVVDNLIFNIIDTILPHKVNLNPGIFIEASTPQDIAASLLNQAMWDTWKEDSDLRYKHVLADLDAMVTGIGFVKWRWNPKHEPYPDIELEAFNPLNVYWTPGAEDVDSCPDMFFVSVLSRRTVEFLYGKTKAALIGSNNVPAEMVSPPMTLAQMGQLAQAGIGPNAPKGDSVVIVEASLNGGTELVRIAGDMITYDGENKIGPTHPTTAFRNSLLPHDFWSLSEPAKIESLQVTQNDLDAFLLEYLKFYATGFTVVDANTGVEPGTLSQGFRKVVRVAPGTVDGIKRFDAATLPPGVFQLRADWRNRAFATTGATDVLQGGKIGSASAQVSGVAVAAVAESAQNRLGLRIFLDIHSLKRMARSINRIQQVQYNDGRVIPLMAGIQEMLSGQALQALQLVGNKQLGFAQTLPDRGTNNLVPQVPFRYRVESDELFPTNKVGRAEMILRLIPVLQNTPAPLRLMLVRAYGLPEGEKIVDAFNQFEQQQAQQMMAAMAAQAQGQPTNGQVTGPQQAMAQNLGVT